MKVEQEKTVLQAQKDQLAQNLEAVMKDKLQPHKQVLETVCCCSTSTLRCQSGPSCPFDFVSSDGLRPCTATCPARSSAATSRLRNS